MIAASQIIVPVPMHYWRFLGRRYNQSALLAQALAKQCGLPWLPDGLKRIRHTQPQPGLTFRQRQDNVKGAFAIHHKRSGALKGGVMSVNVLTLARKAG